MSFVATQSPNTAASEGSDTPASQGSANSSSNVDCSDLVPRFGDDNRPDVIPFSIEEMVGFYKFDVDGVCLGEGETVMVVEGLPEVSGVYSSRDGNIALEGWSFDEDALDEPISRCFVDENYVFMTKAVHSGTLDGDGQGTGVLTTIHVGVTGGGGPFAAVVREVGGADDSGTALFLVTHNYNPGQPDTVKMTTEVWDQDNWTGVAVFESTSEAETYNNRDFSPWTDTQYQGAPNFNFKITLICK